MADIKYIGKCLLIEEKGKKVLVIGDMHLGYEEAMNNSGVFVSRGMFEEVISYLAGVFDGIGKIDEVVLLGDIKHDFGSILKQEREETLKLINWLLERVEKIVIIKGNHDSILEPILKGKKNVELLKSYCFADFCFIHGDEDSDEIWQKDIKKIVIGHVHPGVSIDDGVKREKYKCFLVGGIRNGLKKRELFIVPSFSEHGGDLDIIRSEVELPPRWKMDLNDFQVKIVSEDNLQVLDFGELGKLRK